jgi:hypothetical protein
MAPPPPTRPGTVPVATANETRSEFGPVLLVERQGEDLKSGMRIIVDSPQDWELVRGLIDAVHGPLPPGQAPTIQTVDTYLLELQSQPATGPRIDLGAVRRHLTDDLKGHQAVIYKTVHTPKSK